MSIDHTIPRLVVRAGAGAGKTRMLVERYVHHMEVDGLTPLQIVAVTFTEAAAAELRERIRGVVTEKFGEGDDRVAELEAARIGTVHSLAAAICRQHPEAAGVPPDFTILDDLDGQIWVAERLSDALDSLDPDLMQRIPYSRMRAAVRSLIADPSTASAALAVDGAKTVTKWLEDTRQCLAESEEWKAARSTIMSETGPPGDLLEQTRRATLEIIFEVEAEGELFSAISHLGAISLRGGSQSAWSPDRFRLVKDAVTEIRARISTVFEPLIKCGAGFDPAALGPVLEDLNAAYRHVHSEIQAAKRRRRLLDYADLEIHAQRALSDDTVRHFYFKRWKAFLLDEFQDTNPIQAELLKVLLGGGARVVLVGDRNQSIYGFRRAEPELFAAFERDIVAAGGKREDLDTNYRSHPDLVDKFNTVFPQMLSTGPDSEYLPQKWPDDRMADFKSGLTRVLASAVKLPEKGSGGPIRVSTVRVRRVEAMHIARSLEGLIKGKVPVYDPVLKKSRSVAWRDMAILARTSAALETIAEALGGLGIPYVNAGGGSLLDTREARDGSVLLRWIAEPSDNLALAAVLRSPFCTVSDRDIYHLGRAKPPVWWDEIKTAPSEPFQRAVEVMQKLLDVRGSELPSRILRLADTLTGYSAVIANMPSGRRRAADWAGFRDLVLRLEAESGDVFAVSRALLRLAQAQQSREMNLLIPRPSLEAGDAVTLATIHRSKGLEWSVVVVADLARSTPNYTGPLLYDRELGVGVKVDDDSVPAANVLYYILNQRRRQKDKAEERRILYVACTRARDYLLLSASAGLYGTPFPPTVSPFDLMDDAGIKIEEIRYNDRDSVPPKPENPVAPEPPLRRVIAPITIAPSELPATALQDYIACPKQFHYRHVLGHRGLGEGNPTPARLGTLVHLAIQHNWTTLEQLTAAELRLSDADYAVALAMANRFRADPIYARFRVPSARHETPIRVEMNGISLIGRIDLLGPDFILDFKTPIAGANPAYRLQLWVYTEATGIRSAYLAYLREGKLETIAVSELEAASVVAKEALDGIASCRFEASPSVIKCGRCAYQTICAESSVRGRNSSEL